MNPLTKAIGTVLVLAAGTLGASLGEGPMGLPFRPPYASNGQGGNETGNGTAGNETGDGNETAEGNATAGGNETAEGNETAADGNETADGNHTADGNETGSGGNGTAEGNETADPAPEERSAACSFHLYETGRDLAAGHHEWEWLVTADVQHLWVHFDGGGGVPTGLSDHSSVRLIDGSGRTLARSSSGDDRLHVFLERGVDAMADGTWRLAYESSDALGSYRVQVALDCDKD